MKAVVKYSRTDDAIAVMDVPEPAIGPDQVLVQVKAVGVCGSDIHLWHENQSWAIKLPLVLGHEWSGEVVEVGARVAGWAPGDRVVVETAAEVCGHCTYCLSGHYNLCPQRKGYGNLIDGAMTRYVAARPQIMHRMPAGLSYEHAAMTEPICVAMNALVEKSTIKPGDMAVVQGPGPIGIMALQVLKLLGAGPIIVLGTDADERRLEVAAQLGADYTVNVQREDPLELVQGMRDGFGADVVVDCTGVSRALQQSMALVRPNGRIVKIGWGPQPLEFNIDPIVGKAVTLQGSFSHTYATWERVIGLLADGKLDMGPVIGGVYGLDDWREAFSRMEEGHNVKSVICID